MSAQKFLLLISDIDRELNQLDVLVNECDQALAGIRGQPPSLVLRGIGSILHDFYCGVERTLERIAAELDGELPHGPDWHIRLLERMSVPVGSVRPQAIGPEVSERLHEYLWFRHLFRNVYGFELRWERCRELAEGVRDAQRRFREEMATFKGILREFYEKCK